MRPQARHGIVRHGDQAPLRRVPHVTASADQSDQPVPAPTADEPVRVLLSWPVGGADVVTGTWRPAHEGAAVELRRMVEAVERITGLRIGWLSGSREDWPDAPPPLHRDGSHIALELFDSAPRHEIELRSTDGARIVLQVRALSSRGQPGDGPATPQEPIR